jgi:DNA glycosylase AlkZ-like
MVLSDITRLRLHNQQLLGHSFKRPADVVRWFGALQSQDLASCLYAIGLRMQGPSQPAIEQAIADRSIVRSWPMRRTIHCMPAEDARWMVRLLAPRQNVRMGSYYRKAEISDDVLKRAGKTIESALAGGKRLTRSELYRELDAAGVATSAAAGAMRGLHILVHWAQAGLICMASRQGKQQTFALSDEWMPRGRDLSGEEALAELTKRYFQSHGPATVRDFAWWAGLTMAEAKRGLWLITDSLERLKVQEVEYWLTRDARAAKRFSKNSVFLLPAFDEYTVAYADRSATADEAILPKISHGIAANIVIDGRIAGTWKRKLSRDTVIVTCKLLRRLTRDERAGLTKAVEEYGRFIGQSASIEI